ncbi:flagellar basal-body rod protein FlgG [Psychroserpens ponticola]|uniref:Lipoprotein n=1 Tax=Psychroserpens ponticola TaxID=2932268 RepID=A0ABY7RZ18_9FLAO|nr:hypothetical protein [Psychroserpens ponticola]WCO02379.1 hypothetical protein MUN68_002540 [Psychroserpens ponticola]
MKKFIRLSTMLLVVTVFVVSCQSDTNDIDNNTNLKLISPKGNILAKNLNDLENIVKSTSKNQINNIVFQNIKYIEKQKYTLGVINYYEDDKFVSLLKVIEIDKDYILLKDKHSVQIVKGNSNIDDKSTITYIVNRGSASCSGGNCCQWKETGSDRYNCGCPPTDPSTSVIITTSDGCEVEL